MILLRFFVMLKVLYHAECPGTNYRRERARFHGLLRRIALVDAYAGEFGKTCKNEAVVAAARWARGLNYGGGQRGCS